MLDVWSREQFLDYFGRVYRPGQHVTAIGPTQRGKTHLSLDMLARVVKPTLPVLVLAGKPPERDYLMDNVAADKLDILLTRSWPPPPVVRTRGFMRKQSRDRQMKGWLLKPLDGNDDPATDNYRLKEEFTRALRWAYRRKLPIIVDIDEAYLAAQLGLVEEHESILTRGAPIVSAWQLMQRGRFITYFAYNMAEHVLFFSDPDLSNVRRYAEMVGGVDPILVRDAMAELQTRESGNGMTNSEALYFRRSGSQLVIVAMD
jgi:hypothetical protein